MKSHKRYKFFNVYGQLILEKSFQEQTEINTENWQSGIYFIKNGNVTKKILVNKECEYWVKKQR